jgi:hypothetical protein
MFGFGRAGVKKIPTDGSFYPRRELFLKEGAGFILFMKYSLFTNK